MKPILAVTFLTVSLLFARQTEAAVPVSVKLTLPYNDVLPGVPFDLVVTYTNVSNAPVTITSARATLLVTFADGDTVAMHKAPNANGRWTIKGSRPVRLAPGESVQHAASWENGSIPNWFFYKGRSFSGPGAYGVALDLQIYDDEKSLGSVRTETVTLNRIEPVGIDAELWKRMQEVSGGRWVDGSFMSNSKEARALADEIVQLHPSSGYYPYVLALRSSGKGVWDRKNLPALLEAAERFQASPAYPHLLAAAANCARYEGSEAQRAGSGSEAAKYYTLAESKYREALATKSVAIRASSELGLQQVAHGMEQVKKQPR